MGSVAVDPNDSSKGFYYVSDTEKPPQRTINDLLAIWICLQLYSGKTPKQLHNKLKIYSLKQIKDAPNRPYRTPGFYEDSGSSFMQWWTAFLPEGNVRGAGELYHLRLIDLSKMIDDLSIIPWEHYETKDEYELDKKRLHECISIMIESFYKED